MSQKPKKNQFLTTQNDHILQIQGDCVNKTQQVKEMRHEYSKMKDNERAENEIFTKQIETLKGDVTQLRETQIQVKMKDNERKDKEDIRAEIAIINKTQCVGNTVLHHIVEERLETMLQ